MSLYPPLRAPQSPDPSVGPAAIRRAARVGSRAWLAALPALLLAFVACSGITTSVAPGSSTDLGVFDSYAWSDEDGSDADASAEQVPLAVRIRAAVDAELAAIGMVEAEPGAAHLVVAQRTTIEQKVQSSDPYFVLGPTKQYEEGTLVLDFVDARTGQLVWRGSAQSRLRDLARSVGVHGGGFENTNEERDWRIEEKVKAILADYPRPLPNRGD